MISSRISECLLVIGLLGITVFISQPHSISLALAAPEEEAAAPEEEAAAPTDECGPNEMVLSDGSCCPRNGIVSCEQLEQNIQQRQQQPTEEQPTEGQPIHGGLRGNPR